jgi:hypothetical protein
LKVVDRLVMGFGRRLVQDSFVDRVRY